MKGLFIFVCVASGVTCLLAQRIEWESSFPAARVNRIYSARPTQDGGYIMAGFAGDGTTNLPLQGWVLRLDSQGEKLWEKFYGGTNHSFFASVDPLPEGGYILAGGINNTNWNLYYGSYFRGGDGWVVRLDSEGNRLWEATVGGGAHDEFRALVATENGFLLGGTSASSGQDGNKISPNFGGMDFWLVQMGREGNIVWDRTYANDAPIGSRTNEILLTLQRSAHGGYLLGGNALNNSPGEKPGEGWLLRIDNDLNPVWQHSGVYFYDAQETSDGGVVLATSAQGCFTATLCEYHVSVERLNPDGTRRWYRDFWNSGGLLPNPRTKAVARQTSDGGFIVGGNWERCAMLFRLDPFGEKIWEQPYTREYDLTLLEVLAGGRFLIGGGGFWAAKLTERFPLQVLTAGANDLQTRGMRFLLTPFSPGTFVIERSFELRNWTAWQTNQISGPTEITDTNTVQFSPRFYRARQIP